MDCVREEAAARGGERELLPELLRIWAEVYLQSRGTRRTGQVVAGDQRRRAVDHAVVTGYGARDFRSIDPRAGRVLLGTAMAAVANWPRKNAADSHQKAASRSATPMDTPGASAVSVGRSGGSAWVPSGLKPRSSGRLRAPGGLAAVAVHSASYWRLERERAPTPQEGEEPGDAVDRDQSGVVPHERPAAAQGEGRRLAAAA